MNKEERFTLKTQRKCPYKMPDGYFDSFCESMMNSLPEYPEKPKPVKLSTWQRMKPYVYLAAMFAGIWCMMKVFHSVSLDSKISIDNPPEQVTLALNDANTYDYFATSFNNTSDFELEEEVSGLYNNMESFEKDFGYQLAPKYADMEVSTY